MPSESFNPITGELQMGYACSHCGGTCNMYATGHGVGNCENRRHEFKFDSQTGEALMPGVIRVADPQPSPSKHVDNLLDILTASENMADTDSPILRHVIELALVLKVEADNAWDNAAAARLRGDDRADAWETSKAYTLCRVLGDQQALFRLGVG